MKTESLESIAALLNAAGHPTTVEHPGFLRVEVDADADVFFEVGTVNGPWEIDLSDVRGAVQQLPGAAGLPAESDAKAVADWIGLAVEEYREAAAGPVTDEERSNGRRR